MINGPTFYSNAPLALMNGLENAQDPYAIQVQSTQDLQPLMHLMEFSDEQHRLQTLETRRYLDQHLSESKQRIEELLSEILILKNQLINAENRQKETGVLLHAQIAAKEQELVVCKEEVKKLTSKINELEERIIQQNGAALNEKNEAIRVVKEAARMELEVANKANEAKVQAIRAEMGALRVQLEAQVRDAEARNALVVAQKVAVEQSYEAQIAELKMRNKNFEEAIENASQNRANALRRYYRSSKKRQGEILSPSMVEHCVGGDMRSDGRVLAGFALEGKGNNVLGLKF